MRRASTKRMPAFIRRLAVTWHLGPLQRAYRLGGASGCYALFGCFCLLLGASIVGAFLSLYNSVFSWWLLWQAALIPIVGACWLLVGLWITLTSLFTRQEWVYVFAKGLIYQKRRPQLIRWHEIERLWSDEPQSYRLQCKPDLLLTLPAHLPGISALYRFLEELVTRREIARGLAEHMSGNTLDFGALLLARQGLQLKGETNILFWKDFARLTEEGGRLRVYRAQSDPAWTSLACSEIHNLRACKELIERISEEYARRPSYHLPSQMPQMVDFERGIPLGFGALRISKQGIEITDGTGLLTWQDVACIGVGESEFIIRRQGQPAEWHAIPTWRLADLPALKELVTYIVNKQL